MMTMVGDFPEKDYAKDVCKIGQGAACCRYLTMAADGWSCEKHSSLRNYLDFRVATNNINARGDNCDGKDSRKGVSK